MQYANRNMCFLARIVLEAQTPLKIGSGKDNIQTDSEINRDVNGLPYIPATTIKGLVRHSLDENTAQRIMGSESRHDGCGSWISISEARLIGANGNVIDGLIAPEEVINDSFLGQFAIMPIRQHVRITETGTAADKGKFDEEIIPKGARFCFELELRASKEEETDFGNILNVINSETFRIGGGSRKGYGKVKAVNIGYKALDFHNEEDFKVYIDKSSSLSEQWTYEDFNLPSQTNVDSNLIHYRLELHPTDFLFFSSGLSNENADNTVVQEKYITWDSNGHAEWADSSKSFIIPASSVKGAVSHRTAFYYNALNDVTIESITEDYAHIATEKTNKAVKTLFGSAGEKINGTLDNKRRGLVLFSDIVKEKNEGTRTKVLNHVKIDRFTGGAIEGALFAEESLYAKDESIIMEMIVTKDDLINEDPKILQAFEMALADICKGLLPLGGGVNKGNGCFTGQLYKEGEVIFKT